ncbi:phosphoribosylanthranilate isomerase [Rhizobium sp. BG4]|jgi:phosphoribosylanthranilate isomerase|uniref:phosphoribosylanthranilate isomerase n=1 Tax=Rhizobium sp. BG4 TaxID=2613770 RepID=UPI00193E22E8|nr:phosphoribosylanthranilate isomerase [Rhizobium sp. BG4]QRM43623.1 phosphoribosylanthranilate isomerase [Rhizobium sp. BG4]
MKPDIKICGLKTAEAIDRALARGATHIGFIFFEKSPRYIEPDVAGRLAEAARGKAKIVAVTVNPTNDDLDEIVSLLRPDMIQLHGDESPERVLTIKAVYGLPVMKAFSVRTSEDLQRVEAYIGIADRFLFDAKPPKGSELPGGNGVSFDWSLLSWLDDSVDYMLSGGLNKDNIAEAMAITKAPGIDVSSGVESAPGTKDVAMIDRFFDAVEKACEPETVSGS